MIEELPPGTRMIGCCHLEPQVDEEKVNYSVTTVFLEEIPSEVGWHGECPRCGKRYFSQTK